MRRQRRQRSRSDAHQRRAETAVAGESIVYQINLSNQGNLAATAVVLTDTLPISLTYVSDDSGYALDQPGLNQLVWSVGTVPTGTPISFNLTATIGTAVNGSITNEIAISTAVTETNLSDNSDTAVTIVSDGTTPAILINAVLYDGLEFIDTDEAVQLYNSGKNVVDIGGWQLSNGDPGKLIPAGTSLAPKQTHLAGKRRRRFHAAVRFCARCDARYHGPFLAMMAPKVILLDTDNAVKDVLVYEGGDTESN